MPMKSMFPDVFIEDKPFHEIVLHSATKFGNKTALIDGISEQKLTFIELRKLVEKAANSFYKFGLRKGDVLAIVLPNCSEFSTAFLATSLCGGVSSTLNPTWTEHEFGPIFEDSEAKFLVTSNDMLPTVLGAVKSNNTKIEKIFVVNKSDKNFSPILSNAIIDFKESLLFSNNAPMPKIHFHTKTDLVWLPYSSGTTGKPKGVKLSHYNLTALLHITNNRAAFLFPSCMDNYVAILPFFHAFGLYLMLICLWEGSLCITFPKFKPEILLKLIEKYKPGIISVSPPTFVFLTKSSFVSNYDISSIHTIQVGAAPIGKEISEELLLKHPNVKYITQVYGMTEHGCSHIVPPIPKENLKHGSCGVLVSNYECKVHKFFNWLCNKRNDAASEWLLWRWQI